MPLPTTTKMQDVIRFVVVANHDLVEGILRIRATTDRGKDVETEKHLNNIDTTSIIVFLLEKLLEGIAFEEVGASGKVAGVQVERGMEESWIMRKLLQDCMSDMVRETDGAKNKEEDPVGGGANQRKYPLMLEKLLVGCGIQSLSVPDMFSC
ncbi:hypothetical protein LOK49_LG01G02902 [Camellia lanceoleosa]|uniref:Uncharacterized protein n=1 Tax=Camellia lanceoleosa TaxID=1840588 RepID=A0ACC0J1W4_9ERIC|nr:hypothetical protein LOK49_LG01G02902 [Camellia lanceoleosa]